MSVVISDHKFLAELSFQEAYSKRDLLLLPKSAASKLESDFSFDEIRTSTSVPGSMIERVALDVSSSNNSGASWKTITKGKRSKKPVAKNVNGITKLGDRSPKRVGDFMVSDYDKFNGSITGKLISKEADHIPPKKRHAIQSPSQPQLLRPNDESFLPQPLTPSPHGDSKLQSKGFCGSSALNSRECVDEINNADFSEVVDPKLYNPHDFSGIALLAAAACIDGGIDDDDDACHLKVIEELPIPSMSASSEPMKCSVSVERQSFVSGDNVKENTDTKCSSLDNYVPLPQSLQQNEDVAMKELEATKFDRRYWDLNVMMDDWQEPLDFSGEEAPSVDVSGRKMEVEKLEEEGCKVSVMSGNDSSTSNLRPVNQIEQVKSTLVCSADMVSRGISIIEESSTKHSNDPTPDAGKENKFGDNISSNLGSPAVKMHQLSRGFVDEAPAHMLSENISILCETAKDINQAISSNSVNIVENIGSVGWERSQYGSKTDSVVIATSGKTSELPDNSGSNSSPVQPNSNDFSASSSSSQSVTCTLKGQFDSIPVPDIVVSGSLAHLVHKEPTSFMDEQCLSNAGEEERATVPTTSSPKNVGALSDIPFSGSAKIGSSLDDCRNSDVSQDGRCYTIGSKDMTGYQDGNDSPYEDGELRMLMPCPWEDNEMEDIDNECVDYESDGRGMDSDGADCPGSEVVEAGSEASLGVEKRSSSVREVSFPVVNVSGSLKSNTEMRYMKEETEKTDIGGIKSTSRSFPKMGQFMRNDNLRRRHSYGHLDEIETAGSYSGEMNLRNKGKFQSYGEGSESLHVAGRTNTGYLPQSNRSHTYSRPIRDFSHDKFMGRKRSTYHEDERNGENDQWGEDWLSRNRLAAGRQGPDGHSYNRPRNTTADSSDKLSGGLNSHDHRQSLYYSSKDLHCELNSRSTYERDDFYNGNRRASASTNRSRGSSGNHPQGVGRGFRNEYYNPSHENHTSNSSRRTRYLNGHEPSFSPSSGRLTHNSIPRRRSRSRSRSPHPWHLRERNQVGGRRYTRSPDIRPGSRVRMPYDKLGLHGDYPRSLESPPRGRFPPQHNRRWVNDHHHVENLRNMSSPVRMSERPFRLDSTSSAGRFKEDDYLGPRVRPGRFPLSAGTRRGCNFDNYDDRRRDDRADVICRSRHLDATGRRFRHDPESSDCQDTEDARNTEVRDVPRSSREDRVSCKE